jgi:hypothetical protein
MTDLSLMRQENRRLKQLLARYRRVRPTLTLVITGDSARHPFQRVQTQETRAESLIRTIQELSRNQDPLEDDVDISMDENSVIDLCGADSEESEDEDSEQSEGPFWDQKDLVFRCANCAWEVLDGVCQQCLTEYEMPEVHIQHSTWSAAGADDGHRTTLGLFIALLQILTVNLLSARQSPKNVSFIPVAIPLYLHWTIRWAQGNTTSMNTCNYAGGVLHV